MDNNTEIKIELRAVPTFSLFDKKYYYVLEYRKCPEQLSWWNRNFNNKWSGILECVWTHMYPIKFTDKNRFYYYKEKFKTLDDIVQHYIREKELAESRREKENKKVDEFSEILY